MLGASLLAQKRYEAAEPFLLESDRGFQSLKTAANASDLRTIELTKRWLFELHQAWGNTAKAEEWRKNRNPR